MIETILAARDHRTIALVISRNIFAFGCDWVYCSSKYGQFLSSNVASKNPLLEDEVDGNLGQKLEVCGDEKNETLISVKPPGSGQFVSRIIKW